MKETDRYFKESQRNLKIFIRKSQKLRDTRKEKSEGEIEIREKKFQQEKKLNNYLEFRETATSESDHMGRS